MRLLLFSLLLSTSALAQIDPGDGSSGACTRVTIANGGVFNCTTLNISGAAFAFNPGAAVAIIKVQGDVLISTSVSLEGGIGPNDLNTGGATVAGGLAGPGATEGGGSDTNFSPLDGKDHTPATNANGKAGATGFCGSGGGGGSFAVIGVDGIACSSAGGFGGVAVFSDIPSPLIGGLGGGSGGDGLAGFYGAGGGGGGALHIMAGGNIIINGSISARGGNGGNSAANAGQGGGGGGGGSGGVVMIQSLGQITNNNAINADGGTGGVSADGGNGGNGGHGFVQLEDADGIIDGIGTIPGYGSTGSSTPARQRSPKLSSSISCGIVKPDEDSHSALMQIILGFMLAMTFGLLKKRLKLFT